MSSKLRSLIGEAPLNPSIERPTKFGGRRHGRANTPALSPSTLPRHALQVGCARDLSGDASLAGKVRALGAPTF